MAPSVFWLLLSLGVIVETSLCLRQWGWLDRIDRSVPPGLVPLLPEGYGWWRGVAYARERLRVQLGSLLSRYAGIAVLVGQGWLAKAAGIALEAFPGPFPSGFALGGVLALFFFLFDLPWGFYETFRVENRFGFNRSPLSLFLRDSLLQAVLSFGFSGVLAGSASFLLGLPRGLAWALGGLAVFDLLLATLFPNLVLPLFYRLRLLPEGDLRDKLESLFGRTGFPASALFVADGSRRSTHGNAFFMGLGRLRRVVLFDTLVDRFPVNEAAAVVAHEIGHWKKRHVPAGLLLMFAFQSSFVLFAFLSWHAGALSGAFGLPPGPAPFIVMAFLAWSAAAGLVIQPALSSGSRRREFEADRFAAENEGSCAMIGALTRLAADSLAWTPSDSWFSAWYATHPSVADRILALAEREPPTSPAG